MKKEQIRSFNGQLKARGKKDEVKTIEGYFAVFNIQTELWKGAFEEIAQGAFDNSIKNDVRALINHDSTLVLGRTKSGTLKLETDEKGLKGSIIINDKDQEAINLYERVKRGDVTQCSFGFNIISEEVINNDDGSIKWILKEVELHEVSVCTFPAYIDTSIEARKSEVENNKKRLLESWKKEQKEKIKNAKTNNVK